MRLLQNRKRKQCILFKNAVLSKDFLEHKIGTILLHKHRNNIWHESVWSPRSLFTSLASFPQWCMALRKISITEFLGKWPLIAIFFPSLQGFRNWCFCCTKKVAISPCFVLWIFGKWAFIKRLPKSHFSDIFRKPCWPASILQINYKDVRKDVWKIARAKLFKLWAPMSRTSWGLLDGSS